MNYSLSVLQIKEAIRDKLSHTFGVSLQNATNEEYYKAVALIVRELMAKGRAEFQQNAVRTETKRIYYLCMEFLLGRSLKNNLYNLGLEDNMREALSEFGIKLDHLYDQEPDAGLGNGGLGRLAACFLDGLATQGYPAMGYSLRYEYGLFKQKLVDGWQTELPDFWLPGGAVWMQAVPDNSVEVHFDGHIEEKWNDQYHSVKHKDYTTVTAVPYDLYVSGKDGRGISLLRVWKAENNAFDMNLFGGGNYMRAMEQQTMAEVITKVLYPEDDHAEGKLLRLTQQYFLVSASVQDIIRRHLFAHSNLDDLPKLVAIHLNDTHPVLAIPEMMRVMLDECGYDWESAWGIVKETVAYTNHTVMSEALETWKCDLVKMRLPRIYQIIEEINRRFWEEMKYKGVDYGKIARMAPISDGFVRMANLAVIGSHSVNGVSALHSDILKEDLFHDFYVEEPAKFTNVTNGIAHRRWLCQSNPKLSGLITELIGTDYIYDADKLSDLLKYQDDSSVLERLERIKHENKERLAEHLKRTQGLVVDPDSIFDVQVKRLHEYKRQHMNALSILATYQWLLDNPNADFAPRTWFFGAKAAPGYYFAKQIIQFISALADTINNDQRVNSKMKVVFVENYCVTWAETLIPAAEISEQISLAGTEASGTSNMKFMINGAVTLGTLDGANVEIHETVGDENILLFGMTASQVEEVKRSGYNPMQHYQHDQQIRRALDALNQGIKGKNFHDIYRAIIQQDRYMALADFQSYRAAQDRAVALYHDKRLWNRMSLINIAGAGRFAADRAIRDYAGNIWHGSPVPPEKNLAAKMSL
ncbi:glycogen/starch/alpha-glucan phosphorylase [Acutalibacter muris]|uniref:Alpha-1,4 glucan phosphorylase n=1 Tax=Acutalibacter muris TaxID=1796620 RepID=A0A1Z2XTJ4_9FIRM|nr:glycogen/starch/alpha-glucan phosphorylase [Acutalibacter muris]ANU55021.1 alpha-glucan phosphorylase [Hungateiclostridiaceae bacterium KB18]ASB41745.1 alpha-glucan phosphorylase [Acutalibacter muris]QQR31011.1 glycogen/starch/alpha-glucan phosphorylase [Acutalibacter muris]